MKKLFSFMLVLALIISAVPMGLLNISVDAAIEGYYTYKVSNGEATITDVDTAISGDVTIPKTLGGCTVTGIGNSAFFWCGSLTSIIIPNSVTSIDNSAFCNCDNLTSVTIPDSVTNIGADAFYNCASLISITIPDSVASIGHRALDGCTSLTAINVDENNDYYSSDDGVLFNKDKKIIKKYPAGKTETFFAIPNYVTSIDVYAFSACNNLTNITIPDSVTSIEEGAFYSCANLTNVVMDIGVTSIGEEAFYNCDNLTSVTIPDSVTSIGNYAFKFCEKLTNITIPDSVASIGYNVFDDCTCLTEINVDENNVNYASQDGVLFSANKDILVRYPVGKSNKEYAIPEGVITIGGGAFEDCNNLVSLTIADSVTTIDSWAIDCDNLENVYFGNGLNTVMIENFIYCSNLKNLYVPSVAAWCKISFVSYWGYPSNPLVIAENLYIDGVLATDIVIPGDFTSIKSSFCCYSKLNKVVIPTSVTEISSYAFCDCDNLTDVIYKGTEEQWNAISIGEYNEPLLNANITFLNINNGDVDEDEEINNRDLAVLMKYINGEKIYIDVSIADVNGDGYVNNRDYALLMRYINGWEVELK